MHMDGGGGVDLHIGHLRLARKIFKKIFYFLEPIFMTQQQTVI